MEKYSRIIKEMSILVISLAIIFTAYFLAQRDVTILLNGKNNIKVNINGEYNDEGATILYCFKYLKIKCLDISSKVIKTDNVNTKNVGSYVVKYDINYNGIKKEITRTVNVDDTEAPVITLLSSDSTMYTCPNKEYVEEGYTVTDNVDDDLDDKVVITKEEFGITYTVTDSSGNTATVYREYKYNDTTLPDIILNDEYTYIILNDKYTDPGYKAIDNCDGDITNKVKVSANDIDTSKEGVYTITYSVSDNKGNTTKTTRKIRVYEKKEYNEELPEGNVIYLTFDDGPSIYTGRLLEILDKYKVKVTFFVTGQFSGYNYYIKEEYDKGHSIGLHTYSHRFSEIYKSVNAYFDDISKVDELVYKQTSMHSKLIRFAGGSSNTISCSNAGIIPKIVDEMNALGYKYYDWNVTSSDTSSTDSKVISNSVINGIKDHKYSVVLQHDIKPASIDAVSDIIKWGLDNGYTFMPLTVNSPTVKHAISKCHY